MSLRMIKDVLKPRDITTHCPLCGRAFARFPSDEEHIFPQWLQRQYDLWNRRLNIPNFIGKRYTTVKIRVCQRCNGKTFGQLEARVAPVFAESDAFGAAANLLSDDDIAVWLGKIFWLLIRKSHSALDFRTRDLPEPDQIFPNDLFPGTLYLGMFERAFATGKGLVSCYAGDPPIPEFFYSEPYSLYRFRIDTLDQRFEAFDFADSPVLGVALRSGNFGTVCLFDGGVHRRFRRRWYDFLEGEALHPVQFSEVTARILYDRTVLHEDAARVTYYWNEPLKLVVAQGHTRRSFDPFLAENHDPKRLAAFIGGHTLNDPDQILQPDGQIVSFLHDSKGRFKRFAVTEEELAAARSDPDQIVVGPMKTRWRIGLKEERN